MTPHFELETFCEKAANNIDKAFLMSIYNGEK